MRLRSLTRPASFVVAIALGCSSGGGVSPGSVSQIVGPDGAAISVSATTSPSLAGTELIIPKGALTQPTNITVEAGVEQAKAGETAAGPSVRFLPDGLQFDVPAMMTLPLKQLPPTGKAIAVAVTPLGGARSLVTGAALTVDSEAGTVTLDVSHFTDYEPLLVSSGCSSNSDCASGQVCSSGQCVTPTTCRTDADCGASLVCVAGQCTMPSGCRSDADCGAGNVCVSGVCYAGTDGGSDGGTDGGTSCDGGCDGGAVDLAGGGG